MWSRILLIHEQASFSFSSGDFHLALSQLNQIPCEGSYPLHSLVKNITTASLLLVLDPKLMNHVLPVQSDVLANP